MSLSSSKSCAKDMDIYSWTVGQGTVSKHISILTWGTWSFNWQETFEQGTQHIFAAEVERERWIEKQGTTCVIVRVTRVTQRKALLTSAPFSERAFFSSLRLPASRQKTQSRKFRMQNHFPFKGEAIKFFASHTIDILSFGLGSWISSQIFCVV